VKYLAILLTLILVGCPRPTPPVPDASPVAPPASVVPAPTTTPTTAPGTVVPGKAASSSSTVGVANDTDASATVFIAFGSNSVVLPSSPGWEFCPSGGLKLNCSFSLKARTTQKLPLAGQYLNATISFDKPVTCETTKAELNLNNPAWFDVMDVSLVDGWNKIIALDVGDSSGRKTFGPVGPKNNEKALGVYPFGCDICVARQSPPCGFPKGKDGCKGGTQFAPDVPCQYQGPTMGGGSMVTVRLLAGIPAK